MSRRHKTGASAREIRFDEEHQLEGIQASLVSLRRHEGRLLRRLGERALEILTGNGSLDLQDPESRLIFEHVQRIQRERVLLADRVRSLQVPEADRRGALPGDPGTDLRFPFSR